MGRTGGAKTRAGQDPAAGRDQVALALADRLGVVDLEALRLEPRLERHGLRTPLGRVEEGAEDPALDHDRAVRGEDHVGQSGDRRDGVHGVAVGTVGVDQCLPLVEGADDVDGSAGAHPRVDRVLHGEVSGFADHEAPPALHTGLGHRGVPPLFTVCDGVLTPR